MKYILLFIFCFAVTSTMAIDKYLNCLLIAKKNTRDISFKTKIVYSNTDYSILEHFIHNDGQVWEYEENHQQGALPEIIISRGNETYTFAQAPENRLRKFIIKVTYPTALRWNYFFIDIHDKLIGSWTASYTNYNRRPCYRLTLKLNSDLASQMKDIGDAPKRTYLIDEQNGFIYSCSYYDYNGKEIFKLNMGDVDFSYKPNLNKFELPADFTVKVAKDQKKLQEIVEASDLKKNPPLFAGLNNFFANIFVRIDANFDSIATIGSWITGILGGILILIIIFLKIKRKV